MHRITKRVNTIVTGLILSIILAICFSSPILSYADDSSVSVDQQPDVEHYTSSDKLVNDDGLPSEIDIESFSQSVKNLSTNEAILNIEKVIPSQYLETTEINTTFQHNGLEYGFYLSKTAECFDLLLIDFKYEKLDNYQYAMEVSPILQVSFQRTYNAGEYSYVKISNESRNKYYVANPSFMTVVLNENELNYGDVGYSKANDGGMIIRQSRYNYGSMLYKNPTDLVVECAEYVGNVVFDYAVDNVFSVVSKTGTYGKIVAAVGHTIKLGNHLYAEGNKLEIDVHSNEENIVSNITREAQLENTEVDGFTRVAGIEPKNEIILCDDSASYAEFIIMLAGTDAKTRLMQLCGFNIVYRVGDWSNMNYILDEDGEKKEFAIGKEQTLYEDASVEAIPNDKNQSSHRAYLLNNGSHVFTYLPKVSSTYQFSSTAELSNIDIFCDGNAVESTVVSANTVEVNLIAWEEYTFVFSQEDAGFYDFNFGQKAYPISIGNEITLPGLPPGYALTFVFQNGSGLNVFDIKYEDSLFNVSVYYNGSNKVQTYSGTDCCQFIAEPNVKYYIEVSNRTNAPAPLTRFGISLPTIINLNTVSAQNVVRGTRFFLIVIPVQGNYKITHLNNGLSADILSKSAVNGVYELDAGIYYVRVRGTNYSTSLCVEMDTQELTNEVYQNQYFVGGKKSAFIKYIPAINEKLSINFYGCRITHIYSEDMTLLSNTAPMEKDKTYYIRVAPVSSSKLPTQFYAMLRIITDGTMNIQSGNTSASFESDSTGDKWLRLNIGERGVYRFTGCDSFELYNRYLEKMDINSILPVDYYILKANGAQEGSIIGVDLGGTPIQFSDMEVISTSKVYEISVTEGGQYEIRIAKSSQESSDVILRVYNSDWELIPSVKNGDYYSFTSNDTLVYAQLILTNIGGGGVALMIDEYNATASDDIISIDSYEYKSWSINDNGRYFIIPAGNHTLNVFKKATENIQIVEMSLNGATIVPVGEVGADEYLALGTIVSYYFTNSEAKVYAIYSNQTIVDFMLYDTDARHYIKVKGQAEGENELVIGNSYGFELWKEVGGVHSLIPDAGATHFSVFLGGQEIEEQNDRFEILDIGTLNVFLRYFGIDAFLSDDILLPQINADFDIENGQLVFKASVGDYSSNIGYLSYNIDLELNGEFFGKYYSDSVSVSLKDYYYQSTFVMKVYVTFTDGEEHSFTVDITKSFEWNVLYIGEDINDDSFSNVYIDAKNLSNTNIDQILVIPSYVDMVLIVGDGTTLTNYNINVSDRDNSLNLYFNNLKYQFNHYGIDSDSSNLTLDITGECAIMPMVSADNGGIAIQANRLTIAGSGELTAVSAKSPSLTGNVPAYSGSPGISANIILIEVNSLTVIGGDGGNGANGICTEYAGVNDGKSAYDGGVGGYAIVCITDFIVQKECSYLRLVGGMGGHGGNGANGKNGTEIGEAGGRGGHGGDGGIGGTPYILIHEDGYFYISNETITVLLNGDRGLGGDGGNGGNGGPGANGGNGGNGGDGLYGGYGGNGGHGGHGPNDDQFWGESNPGGGGGHGGHGGHGGYSYATGNYERPGNGGNGGDGGDPGNTGAGTNGGNGGYGYFGGNGGNGSDARGLVADAGDGGDGGDGYGNDPGEGGNGGEAVFDSNNGMDGSDGLSYTDWDNYPWNW